MNGAEADTIVQAAKQAYGDWLITLLDDFNSDAIKHFARKAGGCKDPNLHAGLIEGQDSLLAHHRTAVATLRQELDHLFFGEPELVPKTSFEELELVDDVEVERHILRARMVTWLMNEHRAGIKAVEARLKSLYDMGARVNPDALSPARILDSHRRALDKYGLSDEVRKIYVRYFEETCLRKMIDGYELVNRLLTDKGIDVSLEFRNIKSRQKFMRTPEGGDHYLTHELLDTLSKLNSSLGSLNRAKLTDGGLREKLNEMLPHPQATGGSESRESDEGDDAAVRSMAVSHARQIDFVEKVITAIAKDETLDKRVRGLIQDLIVPVAMLAIQDAEMFSNPNHPGRMLIRELTLFGHADDQAVSHGIVEVSTMIADVVARGAEDRQCIVDATDRIYRINEKNLEDFVNRSKVDRVRRLREIKLKEAKRRVVLELREQLVNHYLPDELRPGVLRLLGPWMVLRYLRYGRNSRSWLESLAYMQLYFKAIQPATNLETLKRRIILRKHMVSVGHQKTAKSSLPKPDVEKMMAAFETYLHNLNEIDNIRLLSGEVKEMPVEDQAPIETTDLRDADMPTDALGD